MTHYPQQPNPYQAPPATVPPKRKMGLGKKILIAVAVFIAAIIAIGVLGSNGSKKSATASSPGQPSSAAPAEAKIGTPVSDGKFQFIVTSVDRSPSAGDPSENAKGEFFNVHLTVKNTGTEADLYAASNQKLIVAGKQFDAASVLGLPNDSDNLNPGLSIDTVVPFDVPPGTQPDAVQLHDSAFSGGVTVNLK